MQVKTCKRCNKLFQYVTGRQVCPKCRKREEELFGQVKDYLRENKGASMEEVSEATGASLGLIQSFLREGRLEVGLLFITKTIFCSLFRFGTC